MEKSPNHRCRFVTHLTLTPSGVDRLHLLLNRSFQFLRGSNHIFLHLLDGTLCALHRLVVQENASTLDGANNEQAEVDGRKTKRKEESQSCFCAS